MWSINQPTTAIGWLVCLERIGNKSTIKNGWLKFHGWFSHCLKPVQYPKHQPSKSSKQATLQLIIEQFMNHWLSFYHFSIHTCHCIQPTFMLHHADRDHHTVTPGFAFVSCIAAVVDLIRLSQSFGGRQW